MLPDGRTFTGHTHETSPTHHAEQEAVRKALDAGAELRGEVFSLTHELRAAGIRTEADYQGRSLKAQFKQANKLNATHMLVIGGDELVQGNVRVRDMATGEEHLVAREAVVSELAGC